MARRLSPIVSTLAACALACAAGMAFTASTAAALPKKFSPYHKLNVFTRVLSYVENNYIEDVDFQLQIALDYLKASSIFSTLPASARARIARRARIDVGRPIARACS